MSGIKKDHSFGTSSSLGIKDLVLVAGGSGGHMSPMIAVLEEAYANNHPCHLITDERGVRFLSGSEKKLFKSIQILSKNPIKAFFQMAKLLLSGGCVIGFGGKMSVMPLLLARLMGKKCVLHQSDAILGKANRFLLPFVHKAFSAFEHKGMVHIGTPVRKKYHHKPWDTITLPLRILVLGGSQGAAFWSDFMPKSIALLPPEQQRLLIIDHQVRTENETSTKVAYARTSSTVNLFAYCFELHERMVQSHLIFSRAGASSVAELGCLGRAAFFVPYPHATGDHQAFNAKFFSDEKAAWSVLEKDLTAEFIAEFIASCLHNSQKLLYAGKKIHEMRFPHAARLLYGFCHP